MLPKHLIILSIAGCLLEYQKKNEKEHSKLEKYDMTIEELKEDLEEGTLKLL